MYTDLFESPTRPFRATPDVRFYSPHDSIETARQTVGRVVRRAEGPAVVMGGAGMGKSLLAELVANDLRDQFDVVKLQASNLASLTALLQNILFELRLPYRELSDGELRLAILDRLEPSEHYKSEGVLFLVDEAHKLPEELLEELRLITNFTRDHQPRARLVLFGSLGLDETFTLPAMESFNQRIAARCYLTPMNGEQTRHYVQHQIRSAGFDPNEFVTHDALQAVYAASDGVPRLANQIMDHALVLGIAQEKCPVSANLVDEAWADLQQLPSPWQSLPDAPQEQTPAVEFGSLGDDDDDVIGFEVQDDRESSDSNGPAADNGQPGTVEFAADAAYVSSEPEPQLGFVEPNHGAEMEPEAVEHQPGADSNFFAAFSEPLSDELPQSLILPSEDGVDDAKVEPLVRPTVVFDASRAFASGRHNDGHEFVDTNRTLPTDSYFEGKPTDEKILALQEEQRQYDMMGVWENDPPISTEFASSEPRHPNDISESEQAAASPAALTPAGIYSEAGVGPDSQPSVTPASSLPAPAALSSCSSESLFGNDFEEEQQIEWVPTPAPEPFVQGPAPEEELAPITTEADEVEPLDSVEPNGITQAEIPDLNMPQESRIAVADADTTDSNEERSEPEAAIREPYSAFEEVTTLDQQMDMLVTNSELPANPFPVSDVVSLDVDREIAVQNEIEEIASQLNFSAFSVEPFSVEQISLDLDTPAAADPDGEQQGPENSAHPISDHEAPDYFHNSTEHFDDDRDLLIVEEDVQVSNKVTDESADKTVRKTAPYAQLFAKLRK